MMSEHKRELSPETIEGIGNWLHRTGWEGNAAVADAVRQYAASRYCEAENWKFAFNETVLGSAEDRDRSIALSLLLGRARQYVTDALDAHRHSDGEDLLRDIDRLIPDTAAMNPKPAEAAGDFETCSACSGQFDGATFRESSACPECETPFAEAATGVGDKIHCGVCHGHGSYRGGWCEACGGRGYAQQQMPAPGDVKVIAAWLRGLAAEASRDTEWVLTAVATGLERGEHLAALPEEPSA